MSINSILDGLRDKRLEIIQLWDVNNYILKVTYCRWDVSNYILTLTYDGDKCFRYKRNKYLSVISIEVMTQWPRWYESAERCCVHVETDRAKGLEFKVFVKIYNLHAMTTRYTHTSVISAVELQVRRPALSGRKWKLFQQRNAVRTVEQDVKPFKSLRQTFQPDVTCKV